MDPTNLFCCCMLLRDVVPLGIRDDAGDDPGGHRAAVHWDVFSWFQQHSLHLHDAGGHVPMDNGSDASKNHPKNIVEKATIAVEHALRRRYDEIVCSSLPPRLIGADQSGSDD